MCLVPLTAAGAGDNVARAHWTVASQASQPMGRSPQASDAPLLGQGGGEVRSSQGSSLCHYHQHEVCWAKEEGKFCP